VVRGGEAFLRGATIPPYQAANTPDSYDPERSRRLLLHQKEIETIKTYEEQKGYTVIPLDIRSKGRLLKVTVAAVRGKKKHDKRQTLKERQDKREIERTIKQSYR
jgi:SsrA-binding protein